MERVLEAINLTKIYKRDIGVKDVSFSIDRGDVFGFLGPNGAGKTTVMKLITGLLKPDSGMVKLLGNDIAYDFEKAMEKVGCIIEAADCYEYMSGYQNLKLASRFYKNISLGRIDEVLELVGLKEFKHEKAGEYSLGMKQRLGLAAAILSKPELIILDEPTNGMDIEGVVDIRNIINNLSKNEKVTFFISSHQIHEIELVCNKVAIINKGSIISEGNVRDIIGKEKNTLEEYFLENITEKRRKVVNG